MLILTLTWAVVRLGSSLIASLSSVAVGIFFPSMFERNRLLKTSTSAALQRRFIPRQTSVSGSRPSSIHDDSMAGEEAVESDEAAKVDTEVEAAETVPTTEEAEAVHTGFRHRLDLILMDWNF